ncbi:MAG: hypothetical protein Edafosvirus1_80 [Edafosvirus sp.]|uniref:Uncharacterized protein n=1 Tax=Edafosvirus sp. TaxID=2487765 RepID=A0A3G4ZWD9_9VIRU|nr:MAG: hypothetical protein Edafosvirus1_80 [Edafosvirus sp.]
MYIAYLIKRTSIKTGYSTYGIYNSPKPYSFDPINDQNTIIHTVSAETYTEARDVLYSKYKNKYTIAEDYEGTIIDDESIASKSCIIL